MPKLVTLPSSTRILTLPTTTSGSITVNSAITASGNWATNRTMFESYAWTINYVNG